MSVIERKVKAIIEDKLGVDEAEITFDVTFEQLGADSLDCVELLMEVEKEFGISISDEEADRMETVGDAIEYIAVKTQSDERDSKSETTHDYEKEILDEISKKTGRQVRKSERWRNFLYAGGLIQTLNDRYGIEMTISDDSLKRADTIGELVSLINSTLQDVITKRDNRPPISENDLPTTKSESTTKGEATDLSNDDIETDIDTVVSKKYEWAITPDETKHQYVIGIDFGHGETSAAYCYIGWGKDNGTLEPVKDVDLYRDGKYVIPSAISIKNNEVYIGKDAFDHIDDEFKVCFKQRPVSINGDAEQLMIKFMREVYTLIRERVGATFSDTNHLVYIATPSGWDNEAQDLYGQMAKEAGIPIAGVTFESRAAFINAQSSADSGLPQYVDKGAIVFDMGSSTLDFTYISLEVLKEKKKPIDDGYDCGASKVEEYMYEKLRDDNNDVVAEFEHKYPKSVEKLLFNLRQIKENYFMTKDHKAYDTIDFWKIVGDRDLPYIRLIYEKGQLEELLEKKQYIDKIRKDMQDFANKHISGKPIYATFFTGGASRMDFLKDLVKEVWKVDYIFCDQNPSLTISRGVAEVARSDIRSGGAGNIKAEIKKIMNDIDVYSLFSKKLYTKMYEEMAASVATPVCNFKDAEEDYSLAILTSSIQGNIQGDLDNIGEWAKTCMEEAFEEATKDIQDKMNKKMANYSKSDIKIGKLSAKEIELPNIDLDFISDQIQEMANDFAENFSEWTEYLTGAAVGAVAAFLFTGPIGWIAGGLTLFYKALFGEEETEEEKREKAMNKPLNRGERFRVYTELEAKWDDTCAQISDAITNVLDNNSVKNKVNTQCKSILRNYAEECLRQTRLMLD